MLTAFGDTWIAFIPVQIGFILLISAPFQYQTTAFWLWLSESQPHFVASHTVFAQKFLDSLNNDSLFDLQINFAPIALLYLLAFIVLAYRFSRNLNIGLVGYMGTLISILFSLLASSEGSLMICFSTAGLIMLITTIEASFSLAYIDELTELPSRRSLDEVMLNLGKTYTIAMLDIDHFKRFNDRYGHKTGDDVLALVALVALVFSKIRGDAKVFRYGGEEFTAIFKGKTVEEAKPYLEKIRQDIAASEFVVRSKSRKKKSVENRGSDKGEKKMVAVTVSIGAATSSKELDTPEKVIKAADAILYKAKRAGRNKVRIS